MLRQPLKFEQINANTCRSINAMSTKIADISLTYNDKATIYDRDLGRNRIIDVKKSFARKRDGLVTFPSGLIKFVVTKANEKGHECLIDYVEPYVLKKKLIPQLPGIKFESFQAKMLRKVGICKRGVLVGPTAMGKSVVLGGIIDKLNIPETIIIVPTQTIFNQLYNSFCNWFGDNMVGRIGQGYLEQNHITVCMFQSIKKYKLNRGKLKLVLIDEVHLINKTIVDFLKRCHNVYYRYGVTATPQKPEKDFPKAMQMQGYVGPIICEVEEKEAENRVLPVKIKLVRYYCGKPVGTNYPEILRKDILLSPLRNAKLMKAAVEEALEKNRTCLFLIDETEQGKIMMKIADRMGIDVTFVHGKIESSKIKNTIKLLNERKIQFVIATKVFGVGTDIPNVDIVALVSCRKSEIDTVQKIGRGRRRVIGRADHLTVYDCVDKVRGTRAAKHFYAHSLERLNTYKEKNWEIVRL